jgi:hypothetical protein
LRCFSLTETSAHAFHNLEGLLPLCAPVDAWSSPHLVVKTPPERGTLHQEAKMGEVIQFISKAERERLRLIREARASYDVIFPPSESIGEGRGKTLVIHGAKGPDIQQAGNIQS